MTDAIARCVCGAEASIEGRAFFRFVKCNNESETCWAGPVCPTESEAIAAWNGVMGLRAELEATRRQLARARVQALYWLKTYIQFGPNARAVEFPRCLRRGNKARALRLLNHYARKFEREAAELEGVK